MAVADFYGGLEMGRGRLMADLDLVVIAFKGIPVVFILGSAVGKNQN